MNLKELLIKEVNNTSDSILAEVWDFLQFLKKKYDRDKLKTTLLSESSLQKDWLRSEEDEAWRDL